MSSIRCQACGTDNPSTQWACSSCGASFARQYDMTLRPTRCRICEGDLEFGWVQVRTGGANSVIGLMDVGMAWTFESIRTATCVRCGHIDLYAS